MYLFNLTGLPVNIFHTHLKRGVIESGEKFLIFELNNQTHLPSETPPPNLCYNIWKCHNSVLFQNLRCYCNLMAKFMKNNQLADND